MGRNYRKVPKVRTPYLSRLSQFDALEIHYDDEHRKYHICGANYNAEKGLLIYFPIDPNVVYPSVTSARMALLPWIFTAEDGFPMLWEKPVKE